MAQLKAWRSCRLPHSNTEWGGIIPTNEYSYRQTVSLVAGVGGVLRIARAFQGLGRELAGG